MIRLSSSFVRTLREDPADAEVASHKLLVRAGYIRRSAPGVYTWLPLGLKVLRKVEQIVREEQDAIGGQERSEEHTSELQSRGHLVCRLLLEKKKKKNEIIN